jgi:glucokinase
MTDLVAAIDLGGTAMKGALVREDCAVEHAESRPTGRQEGADAVVERLAAFAGDLVAAAPGAALAVGVTVPGLVDEAAGVARTAVNLGWRDVPLRRILEQRLGLPVAVAHDVRAAARAEAAAGAARGRAHWLLVTVGTGVGAAVVVGGTPYGGAHGRGGELGHVVVAPDGPRCACGARGCVETLGSAAAVERRYAERVAAGRVSAEQIVERAGAGDEAAAEVWATPSRRWRPASPPTSS